MADNFIQWGLVAILAAFVVMTALTWRAYQRYRKTLDRFESKLSEIQSGFDETAKSCSELGTLGKNQVGSSEFEAAMAQFMARLLQKKGKTVVRTRG